MRSLYVTHTPYHVILASALALEGGEPNHEQYLLGILDSDMEKLLGSLRESADAPFDDVRVMAGNLNRTGRRKQIRAKYNSRKVRQYVADNDIDHVYSFNDYRPEDQAAFDAVGDDARRVYVEDGTGAYVHVNREWNWFGALKMKMFYGRWRTLVREHGTSPWIDEVRVSFPEHARLELRDKPISALPRRELSSLAGYSWFRRYVSETGVGDELTDLDGVVFITHSEYVDGVEEYVETMRRNIERLVERGHRIGVKYHPRETTEFLDVDQDDVIVLPHGVPAEVLFLASPDMQFVLGDDSTALLSASLLLEDAMIISLIRVFQSDPSRLASIFEELGLDVPESYSDIAIPEP